MAGRSLANIGRKYEVFGAGRQSDLSVRLEVPSPGLFRSLPSLAAAVNTGYSCSPYPKEQGKDY